ncbi:hypothetical protein BH10BAC4_BH10BAC4_07360 [soil metagenome]
MSYQKKHAQVELSTSSMADIAFLMLTFFLITTNIENRKGLTLLLPGVISEPLASEIHSRNLFKIQINSQDQFLIEDELRRDLVNLKSEIKMFINNYGVDATLSANPEEALVSLKTDRGTSYAAFINALDEIQGAYYEIYAQRAQMSTEKFRLMDLNAPANKIIYENARKGFPMRISIAEPTRMEK